MSWYDIFTSRKARDVMSAPLPVLSGYADSSRLEGLILAEALGQELSALPMDRRTAMTIPAVSRGRNLIVAALTQLPLKALNESGQVPTQPTFLYRSDSKMSPQARIAQTVDDLIFWGESLWAVQRGSRSDGSAHGPILDAVRVPRDRWEIDQDGRILVDSKPVDEESVIYIKGWTDGLINTGYRTLKGALATENAWVSRVRNPIPLTVIQHTQTSEGDLEPEEVRYLIDQWTTARRSEDGALGYLPAGLEIQTHGDVDAALYVEGRNAIRVDIASLLGIPASLLDGSVAEASLTYVTTEGNANRFVTETLPLYMGPIEAALSADAVVPRGQRVRFDLSQLTTAPANPTGAPVED